MNNKTALPKISVIMPVLNGEKTIRLAIQSIINQDYPNFELIILDGQSADNTLRIIETFKQYITYLESSNDGNPTVAVNKGLRLATGDLIVTLMCDDFYEAGTFKAIASAYQTYPNVDMYTCGGRLVEYNSALQAYKIKSTHASARQLALNFHNICFANPAICCRFIKRSLFGKIGIYTPTIDNTIVSNANDKEFLLRAVISGAKNHTINFIGHNYVSHPGSLTFSGNRKMTAKLYVEHCYFANRLKSKFTLTSDQIKMLDHWYCHQSARLAFYRLVICDFKQAFAVIKQDLPKHPIKWMTHFIFAPIDFLLRRGTHKLKKIFTANEYL